MHEVGITTSMNNDSSSSNCFPRFGVTTGFLIQSISTLDGRDQEAFCSPMLDSEIMSPFAIASATFSPKPEHLLVFTIDTIDIVPLAKSSSALSTVHVYRHLQEPFRNEWHVPALSQKIVYVLLPCSMIAVSKPCKAAIDSNSVVDRPWLEIQVEFPGHTNLTKVLLVKYTLARLCSALLCHLVCDVI